MAIAHILAGILGAIATVHTMVAVIIRRATVAIIQAGMAHLIAGDTTRTRAPAITMDGTNSERHVVLPCPNGNLNSWEHQMNRTTDFEEWLDSNEIETQQEKEGLIEAISEKKDKDGFFIKVSDNGHLLVTGMTDLTLVLASEKARQAFLSRVQRIGVTDELEEGFQLNMRKSNT